MVLLRKLGISDVKHRLILDNQPKHENLHKIWNIMGQRQKGFKIQGLFI